MLQDLPPECLRLIVGHLPTVSSIINLALTSRHFYTQVSADEFATLREFVQNAFPSIKVSPPWKDTAIRLTSRSRAWDRRAFVARECYHASTDWQHLSSASNYGFVPAIDSYETNLLTNITPRKEVLAHSAAGRVLIRVQTRESCTWSELKFDDDQLPNNDILDLHLLRPHQQHAPERETIVFRRANGEISKVETHKDSNSYEQTANFVVPEDEVDCLAINDEKDPLMALCTSDSLYLYPIHNKDLSVRATAEFQLEELAGPRSSTRCARFISDNLLAIGRPRTPIQIYNLDAMSSHRTASEPLCSLHSHKENTPPNLQANVLRPMENGRGTSGNLLLSGWSDGVARLFDMRSPLSAVASFRDSVDDGQIMSLLPIGLEKFLAGGSQNGCLKTFDLRLPGMRPYSRRSLPKDASQPSLPEEKLKCPYPCDIKHPDRRGINIFVAPRVGWGPRTWQPVFKQALGRSSKRYSGAIYSLSSPSSASPTVYTGITDHVVQLDFVSTDDIYKDGVIDPMLRIPKDRDPNMLSFPCYERPREGHEMTDPVLLRPQIQWSEIVRSHTGKDAGGKPDVERPMHQPGWDERWIVLRPKPRFWRNQLE